MKAEGEEQWGTGREARTTFRPVPRFGPRTTLSYFFAGQVSGDTAFVLFGVAAVDRLLADVSVFADIFEADGDLF
jgi:hypothetical protein